MARIKGQANYASNFEVLKQAPLDSRTVVSDSGDLTKIATWQDADGNVWLYDGLIVTVPNTNNPSAPEVYVLKDKDNYGRRDAWLKLGADNASAVAAIQEALKKKANLVEGKVSATELPIVTSLVQTDDTTIPSAKLVNEALTSVGNTLENKINEKVVGLLHWQGVKSTTSEIKDITSAKKGDVWHSNGDGSEWVCTKDISTADGSAWTELGTPIDLSGYYTKDEVDFKYKTLADSIGDDNDAASANGSAYARIKKNADDIADNTETIGSCKDKIGDLDSRVTANKTAIGTDKDAADANGSLYARVKKNADDIATKASNEGLAALDSKVAALKESVGNTTDDAKVDGSVYARIAKNKADIATKANQSDIPTAVQLVVKTI